MVGAGGSTSGDAMRILLATLALGLSATLATTGYAQVDHNDRRQFNRNNDKSIDDGYRKHQEWYRERQRQQETSPPPPRNETHPVPPYKDTWRAQ